MKREDYVRLAAIHAAEIQSANEDEDIAFQRGFLAGVKWINDKFWIPVVQHLPNPLSHVLLRDSYGAICMGFYSEENEDFVVFGDEAYRIIGEIVDWQPIIYLE